MGLRPYPLLLLLGCHLSWSQAVRVLKRQSPLASIPEAATSLEGESCFQVADCCAASDKSCGLFCKEGSEIDKGSIQGWRVKGVCAPKWDGFCMEDEECGLGLYCSREHAREGTCVEDSSCGDRTCRRGTCRAGKCTCEFGFTGEHCDSSTEAFAFLFYGNSTENLVSTRVLLESLRAAGGSQDVVAIIPTNLADSIPPEHKDVLTRDGVKLFYSEPILMPASMDVDPVIHQRWSGVMNKFAAWRLIQYTQVALVDTDMVFSLDSENPGKMFQECSEGFCAVRDGDSRFLNAGLMILSPSMQRLAHILHVLSNEQHHFAMPEQSFLTKYCEEPSYKMKLQDLDKKWNSCVGGGMLENTGWQSTGYNLLHSCSWLAKPPNMEVCQPSSCDPEEQLHTVLTWQHFLTQADSCIRQTTKEDCDDMGIKSCRWCGHYCGRDDISCSAKLFASARATPSKELDAASVLAELSEDEELLNQSGFAAWDALPQGSWAWPEVALYQILIDRFASSEEKVCDKLDDYCGGTFEGIRRKLDYLQELGVDGMVLSPVVEQMPHGYHGYWTKSLDKVNPNYGTAEELRQLVLIAQKRMKVVVDVNLNHAGGPGIDANSSEDVAVLEPFNSTEHYHQDNCSLMHNEDYERGPFFLEHCALYGLPDYNHENPVVWQGLNSWLRAHVDGYGFDGIRVDAARHISQQFLRSFPASGAPIPAFREVVHGDMDYVSSFAAGEYDAVYNYPLYFTLREIFAGGHLKAPMSKLGTWMTDEAPKAGGRLLLNFLENNDLPRFIDKVHGNQKLYRNALVCITAMEGLPVLLYGSEQNARGFRNESDLLKVDNWRPPLWHIGYNTSTLTFQMLKKVLWLRKQHNGMHALRQQPMYSDSHVLVFGRGPFIFLVTNEAKEHRQTQRVVWHNATSSEKVGPSKFCNLLAADPQADCTVISPGNLTRYHFKGEPQLFVPDAYVRKYLEAEKAEEVEQKSKALMASAATQEENPILVPPEWRGVPGIKVKVENVPRIPRALRPMDVEYGEPELPRVAKLPRHKDVWTPPVGVKTQQFLSATLDDACFFFPAESGEDRGFVYAQRSNRTYLMCPMPVDECQDHYNYTSLLQSSGPLQMRVPVFHANWNVWSGIYHMLISSLPFLAPYWSELQGGSMQAFFTTQQAVMSPVLRMLGLPDSAFFFPPTALPLKEPFHFCSSQITFGSHSHPFTNEFSTERLRELRVVLRRRQQLPGNPSNRKIVILSRGNGSRFLNNEAEMVDALQGFGLPIEVIHPKAETVAETVDSLNEAAVVIGGHGANLANIMFAPAGVGVIEIVPQAPFTLMDHHFRNLAGGLGLRYVPVGAPVLDSDLDKDEMHSEWKMDRAIKSYAVDVAKVVAAVDSLL